MEYTLHSTEFVQERRKSACALLKGEKKGEKVLAIAGGFNAPGLEVWNPADDSVTMMTPDFPPESVDSLDRPQMISVKDGTELIYYRATNYLEERGIWKYFQSNNTWIQIGELLHARGDFVVLPVRGVTCP